MSHCDLVLCCLLVSAAIFARVEGQQDEGDSCVLAATGQAGTCTNMRQCRSAIEGLRKGINPQICTFQGTVPVVCCASSGAVAVTSAPVPNTPPAPQPLASGGCPPVPANAVRVAKTGQKAWDKCIDLAETVFPCKNQATLLLNSKKVRVDTCTHSAVELIVGGTPAKAKEFPHMALLGFGPLETVSWECGGTLVSEQWVLTAGHCLFSRALSSNVTYVRLGGSNVDGPPEPENTYAVATLVKHPDYTGNAIYNDIALLQLDRAATFTTSVRPACLHVGNPVNDNKAIATGWGVTTVRGARSNALLKVTLDKFSYDSCVAANPPTRKSKDGVRNATQICAGSQTEIKDTCQGDSGGPLQIYNRDVHCTYTIIGITSTGKACATPGIPALYTRVSAFVPWIESVVWP